MEIDVIIERGLGRRVDRRWLKRIAAKALATQGLGSKTELGLVIAGQEKIHQLNLKYLGRDEPTDVLAFPMLSEESTTISFLAPPDDIKHLGEVIISYPQAVIQAEEQRHSVVREIAILLIHGILHLLGYDHDRPDLEQAMRHREAEVLSQVEEELT